MASTVYHLVLFLGSGDSLSRELVRIVRRSLSVTVQTKPEETEIHVWVDSGGGDAHAVYKLVLELRSWSSSVHVVVPDYAKSAATLLSLAADQLSLSAIADLGPLDVQISHPDRENLTISALDVADSISALASQATELACFGGATILQMTGLTRETVLSASLRFMSDLLAPSMEKIDPHLVLSATKQLNMARGYAERLMTTRRVPPKEEISRAQARAIAKKFVDAYPTHGHIIDRQEARKCGLRIFNAEDHPRWGPLSELCEQFNDDGTTVIEVIPDVAFDKKDDVAPHAGNDAESEQVPHTGTPTPPTEQIVDGPSPPAHTAKRDGPKDGEGAAGTDERPRAPSAQN